MRIETDFLVIGSGIAGLTAAHKLSKLGKVLVITKTTPEECNTKYAQGGIAGVFAQGDTFEKHVQDTHVAGDGLCKDEVVKLVVQKGPERIRELMEFGTKFDYNEDGSLMLGKEGGHSENRILHAKDATGAEIERALLETVATNPNIELRDHFFAIDLITQHHLGYYINRGYPNINCFGVYALDLESRKVFTVLAKATILAAGGVGNIYTTTTNPSVATGDGIAMVYRAMGRIANMEFNQFHPTALYDPGVRPAFLITEALRGKGAVLRSGYSKTRFMKKYDPREDLAPRDIVARAIDNEMKQSGIDFAYLDATHIPAHELKDEFPTIYERCLAKGIDITKDLIPVVPASHYTCGGILVDTDGKSSIHGLFAAGECTCSGLHGANRLASNSLLEGIVYAQKIFETLQKEHQDYKIQENIPDWTAKSTANPEEWVLISHNFKEVQSIMSDYVGIVRSNHRLERAERRINLIYEETEDFYRKTSVSPEMCELRNIITCAHLVIKSAKARKESRGLHFTTDYPDKLEIAMDTII